MKKLIVILLVCVFILSMAACGKKASNAPDTQPQDNNASQSQSGAMTPDNSNADTGDTSSESSQESTAPAQEPTEPSQDANKVEPTPETNKDKTDKDEDIKVEIDNDGNNADTPVITPPDDNNNNSFVIDFDDLLEASKK